MKWLEKKRKIPKPRETRQQETNPMDGEKNGMMFATAKVEAEEVKDRKEKMGWKS